MSEVESHEEFGRLYTIGEAQNILRCSYSTIYKLAREDKLELVKLGKRHTRITERSVKKLIKAGISGTNNAA